MLTNYKYWIFFTFVFFCGCLPDISNFHERYSEIFESYQHAISKDPENESLRLELAGFLYDFKDYEKLTDLLRESANKKERILLAKAYVRKGEYRQALAVFEHDGFNFGDDQEAQYLYAYALEKNNMFAKAIDVYRAVSGDWESAAAGRISNIIINTEEDRPDYITALESKYLDFEKEAKEGAIYLLVDEKIEVTDDNKVVSKVHVIKKILDDRGKSLAEAQIGYDSTYEDVELSFARVITSNKVVYVGDENIRDVSRYSNFPLYSNAKVRIVSMPAVQVGSIIEYEYVKYTDNIPGKDMFSFVYSLQEAYPVAESKFSFIVPRDKKVNINKVNLKFFPGKLKEPQIISDSKKIKYNWSFDAIEAIVPEEKMPPYSEITAGLILSGVTDWDSIYDWWHELYKDKISVSDEMRVFLQDLLKDTETDEEKAKRIHEFCARDIRYVAVEYGASGYEPHKAEDVFVNRYGDCKDQAILLVALMREAGLDAYPVLIPTKDVYNMDKSFPVLLFNHAISVININGSWKYLDPTSSTTGFNELPSVDQGRNVLIFLDDKVITETTPSLKDNEVFYETKIKINEDESADINRKITTKGFFSAYQRHYLKFTHPKSILEDIMKKVMGISPFSKLKNYQTNTQNGINYDPILEYSFSVEKLLSPSGSLRVFEGLNNITIDTSYIGKEERLYPIDFNISYSRIEKTEIELPESLIIKFLPKNSLIENKWFIFSCGYSQDKKNVIIERKMDIKETNISVGEYQEFKKALKQVIFTLKEAIIMEHKKNEKTPQKTRS